VVILLAWEGYKGDTVAFFLSFSFLQLFLSFVKFHLLLPLHHWLGTGSLEVAREEAKVDVLLRRLGCLPYFFFTFSLVIFCMPCLYSTVFYLDFLL